MVLFIGEIIDDLGGIAPVAGNELEPMRIGIAGARLDDANGQHEAGGGGRQ